MKLSKILKILAVFIIINCLVIIIYCDRRVKENPNAGAATISINLALAAPGNVSSITLNISGPGMTTITRTYNTPIPAEIELDIPVGDDRVFELVADTGSATFSGQVTTDLPVSGNNVTDIDLSMSLSGMRLVIPDAGNNRIVQIDDMSGNGWTARTGVQLGVSNDPINFEPRDVDFDNRGRIYIANAMDGPYGAVYRIDNIDGDGLISFAFDPNKDVEIVTLSVDRENEYVYFATETTIYRATLDGNNITQVYNNATDVISGICYYNNLLLIAHRNGGDQVFSVYNLANSTIEDFENADAGSTPTAEDIIVKNGRIYGGVAADSGDRVMEMTIDQNNQLTYDDVNGFYSIESPIRFIDDLSSSIYFIQNSGGATNRIIKFDDIIATNTVTNFDDFGETGSGTGQFLFW